MTAIYDRRAARTLAKGEAAKATAEAERVRAQTARAEREAAAEQQRQERRERAAERRERWARWREAAPDRALSALWAALIVAPLLLAWNAQEAFAHETLRIPAGMAWLFPLAIESGAWVCAFEAHRRASRSAPVGSLLRWMWLLAGIAAGINAAHGIADFGVVAGLALGTLSVLGVLLHHIRQNLNAAEAAGTSAREVSQRFTRWVLFPRLSWDAWRIATRAGLGHPAAWEAAWIDRYGVGPAASKRDRRLAKVIVKRQMEADRKAAEKGELTIINGVILRATLPATTEPERAPAAEVSTPIEQRKLSPRATELLAEVRTAIAAGELPERPSASAIRKRFKPLAMETAQEIRDALTDMHPVNESEAA
ncbi:hypothetical protein [Saccharopolyspora rosea]|uniref:DUF2637 domain-containing protein n=1 Tax=Saccharopolyspora rosea TaxID=524884 RepID=A0ABW3G270_9PSEU|nr:hypothetical protein [Saccharopolyspora rosea]